MTMVQDLPIRWGGGHSCAILRIGQVPEEEQALLCKESVLRSDLSVGRPAGGSSPPNVHCLPALLAAPRPGLYPTPHAASPLPPPPSPAPPLPHPTCLQPALQC